MVKRLRKMGYVIHTEKRTIETGYASLDEIPTPDKYYVLQLLKLGFQQEFSLF